MDPSKAPQGDPPPRVHDNDRNTMATTTPSQWDLSDSLNRLTLASAAAVPLPPSPSSSPPHDGALQPNPPIAIAVDRAPTPKRDSSSHPSTSRNEHGRTLPVLQKRASTTSLRSVSQPVGPTITSANVPVPKRTPSSNSLRDEHRKSIPTLQKRPSTASLRLTGPTSPIPASARRSSPNHPASPTSSTSPAMASRLALSPTEAQAPTAATVAAEHFRKEVDLHQIVDLKSNTVVVVHDACYGHRFSRPRASKAALASIVERPERIRACALGISAAYVSMGRRHEGERFALRPDLDLSLLPPPPFQIRKTSRSLPLHDLAVTNVHGAQWMTDLKGMCDVAESRLALGGKELVRPRPEGSEGAVNAPELHSGDLYLCSESLDAFQGALGGVCDGIDAVFDQGPTTRAFVCIRPPGHHCSADFPSGFCWVNNVLVGISYAAINHGLTHAAILDFDLHHGDGSQDIVWDHNYKASMAAKNAPAYKKTAIGYYSLHDINSYPCEGGEPDKVRNASVCVDGSHGQSVWNVHLETWENEADFWELYRTKYITLINKARNFLRAQSQRLAQTPGRPAPKAAIFISAGFDASEWEGSGMQRHKVNVPTEFYARFTADVVRMSREEGLGVDGRVISVLEGGYSDRALTSGVLSHLAGLADYNASLDDSVPTGVEYESKWWSSDHLSELEALTSPQIKRERTPPTFLASTKSFDAKVLSASRDRKSFGSYTGVTPPPPDVDWATAAYELSKVLIPDESRQTMSCQADDLNAEASRQRRERQLALDGVKIATLPPPPPPEERRLLRVRKTKSPAPFSPRGATPRQQAMRKNRRRTIDGNDLPDTSGEVSPSVDAGRRKSSNASTVSTEPISMGDLTSAQGELVVDPAVVATPTKVSDARRTSGRMDTPRRSASPRKAPPVPKVPAAYLPSNPTDEATPTSPANEVENISVGFQRIKLKLPPPEEQAAREKKAAEERKSRLTKTKTPKSPGRSPRKATTARTPRGKTSLTRPLVASGSSPPRHPGLEPMKQGRTETQPISFLPDSADSSMMDVTMQDSDSAVSQWPSVPSIPASVSQEHSSFGTNTSPPFTPNLTQAPEFPGPQANTYTPPMAAGQTKQGLPVFTSSSPIPFASPGNK
ncbi:hypothetical protein PMG11_01582 [Penicillium brasilianum]|uniref:Histone deacetylase domain-containing protein n=1 Tax=Penicillium brasilianum TaxID=104259 RepID=A0A0F7TJW9_PENBI|nr:hypothetical protein PMG11_01582 [Penicillium brasilianum]